MKAAQRSERQTRGPIRLCQSSPAHSLTLTFSEGATGQPAPAALEHSTYRKEITTHKQPDLLFPLLFSIQCVSVLWYRFTVAFPSYISAYRIFLLFLDHIIFYHSTIPYFSTQTQQSTSKSIKSQAGWMDGVVVLHLLLKKRGNRPRRSR